MKICHDTYHSVLKPLQLYKGITAAPNRVAVMKVRLNDVSIESLQLPQEENVWHISQTNLLEKLYL